jgi:hypothetical protein
MMSLDIVKQANLALTFFLELAALVALGYWGFSVGQGTWWKIVLGVGVPLLMIVLWSMLGAPRSAWRLQGFAYVILEIVFYGSAVIGLFHAGQPIWSGLFGLICIINLSLNAMWHQ